MKQILVKFPEILQPHKCSKPIDTVYVFWVSIWKFLPIRQLTFFNHVQCIRKGISALMLFIFWVNAICKVSGFYLSRFGLVSLDEWFERIYIIHAMLPIVSIQNQVCFSFHQHTLHWDIQILQNQNANKNVCIYFFPTIEKKLFLTFVF